MRSTLFALFALLAAAGGSHAAPVDSPKTLRYAFRTAETSFDPAYITDLYSRVVAANMFDAPLEFEFLANPVRLRPNTLAEMPEISADFKTFTFRLKRGIYFADDPAFKGHKRELTAADYVYSLKRHYEKLMVAPVNMRDRFLELIVREQEHQRSGRPAQIIGKMNSLEDRKIVSALYDAAKEGVSIDLIVRGTTIAWSLAASALSGIAAGWYPARRAVRLDVITAIRAD